MKTVRLEGDEEYPVYRLADKPGWLTIEVTDEFWDQYCAVAKAWDEMQDKLQAFEKTALAEKSKHAPNTPASA